ncbi:MAG: relaxase/mobilization nuclease domain-containing protein, partial [Xanthobacteraceae bacterium]|nr:relaxase/mobilization nuclease domain-containing protein [Xanthobacteraceae bacterium]
GRALEEMWRTAEDQAYLKMQAGVKRGGRVCEDPTKTLSMSWHKDDKPTPEHMVEAADALLKHMGWDAHQAVYVGHNDTEHRHIHIILNRVNPENGRTLDDFREQKRAQSWALRYEREQEQVRCEQREINAAREAGRSNQRQKDAVESNVHAAGVLHENAATRAPKEAPSLGRPANDHLPHNVILLTRPHEREFADQEQLRKADADLRPDQAGEQKAELKDRQRAEREAFFKDGAKLFKATRHAAYDEVRQEYRAEWRQFYKDSDAAQKSAEASSETAIGRAFYFARAGQWEAARDAFNDRDSVRDAVVKELSERKADLKDRQTGDLRERQRDACDALRDVRDVQYQELLQRQRDERAAFNVGQTLQSVGVGVDRIADQAAAASPERAANENRAVEIADVLPQAMGRDVEDAQNAARPAEQLAGEKSEPLFRPLDQTLQSQAGGYIELPRIEVPAQETIAPARGVSDLAAASVGSVASYLADQLGELFAPTPPEVREAQAKAAAKRETEPAVQRPEQDDKATAYARIIDSAVRLAEAERAQQGDAYWKERDRGKGFERDQ